MVLSRLSLAQQLAFACNALRPAHCVFCEAFKLIPRMMSACLRFWNGSAVLLLAHHAYIGKNRAPALGTSTTGFSQHHL